jgi:UDP-N-acetylmuramoyl-L-alanyl-D-glutamate--2,6-diaminopimelate ligase
MNLGELLAGYADVPVGYVEKLFSGLAIDSRIIQSNEIFLALRGEKRHGLEFFEDVKKAGAAAVIWEPPYDLSSLPVTDKKIPLIAVSGLRHKLGLIVSRFYGEPSRNLRVVGITGTEGKTSCAHFIAQALSDQNIGPCGILGTLGNGIYGQVEPTLCTTPDSLAVQLWLAEMVAAGRYFAAMEVSSHALDQGRVNGVTFSVAVLTNLSHDHLDYHRNLASYSFAKRRLFFEHNPSWIVLNLDDGFGRRLIRDLPNKETVIGYGIDQMSKIQPELFVWGENLELTSTGLKMVIRSSWGIGELQVGLLGRFNASNILATVATLLALDFPFHTVLDRVAKVQTVIGRMERLGGGTGQPLVVVDYAHTPNALEQVLVALREHRSQSSRGLLWCLFGCGGDRDSGKRPLMGAIAENLADRVLLTNDNPRTEEPNKIINDILAGMQEPARATVIHDRRTAITHVLVAASDTDIVLIAGKGHEDYQIFGTERQPFSDYDVIRQYFSKFPITNTDYS